MKSVKLPKEEIEFSYSSEAVYNSYNGRFYGIDLESENPDMSDEYMLVDIKEYYNVDLIREFNPLPDIKQIENIFVDSKGGILSIDVSTNKTFSFDIKHSSANYFTVYKDFIEIVYDI